MNHTLRSIYKSLLLVSVFLCLCVPTPVGFSKRGRDTESDANIQQEEMHTFFSNEFSFVFPSEIPRCGLLILLLITQTIYVYCGISFFVRKKEHEKAGVFLETSTKESIIVCDE